MAGRVDIDFIKKGTSKKDIELFLGPVSENQQVEIFEPSDKLVLAHFVAKTGVFPSVGQARKNGWNKPVPEGFSQFIIGKQKAMITILNIGE